MSGDMKLIHSLTIVLRILTQDDLESLVLVT